MQLWRICKRRFARSALDGQGAKLVGGRWNPPGLAVAYASGSLSLAALELLVHVAVEDLPADLVSLTLTIPEGLAISTLNPRRLPKNWRSYPAPAKLQAIGQNWLTEAKSAFFCVPSAVIPTEFNYLLNPSHPDFKLIKIGKPQAFRFDPRLRS